MKNYDVIVIGGGIGGVSTAYNLSKNGIKTLLIEKEKVLGGLITLGFVVPMMIDENDMNTSFLSDLKEFATKENATITFKNNPHWYNIKKMPKILFDMLKSVNCKVLLNFDVKDAKYEKNIIKSLVAKSNDDKMLSLHINSKYFVDATGNSNFSKILNCSFNSFKNTQSNTLRFTMKNVDLLEFSKFLSTFDDKTIEIENIDDEIHLSCAYTNEKDRKWALEPYFKRALEDNVLKYEDLMYFQLFTIAKEPNCLVFNCPKVIDNDITRAKEAIKRYIKFVKTYFKGFSSAELDEIAPVVGVRGARTIKTKYTYTLNDMITHKRFDDEILSSTYPVDVHSDKKDGSSFKNVGRYYFPLSALMSIDYDNLFIVGKHVGSDISTQGALRIQPTIASMGEGVANYLTNKINGVIS